jgi:hypothetical protein
VTLLVLALFNIHIHIHIHTLLKVYYTYYICSLGVLPHSSFLLLSLLPNRLCQLVQREPGIVSMLLVVILN